MASTRLSTPSKRGTRPAAGLARVDRHAQHQQQERHQDDAEEHRRRPDEPPVAARLQGQQQERDRPGDQPAGEQRRGRTAGSARSAPPTTSARSVAMATSSACTHSPQHDRTRGSAPGSSPAGCAPVARPELRRQALHQHRHEVGRDDHPEQQVAELGAGGDVGREVAGVDVGDGGDEGRAEERQPAPARGPDRRVLLQHGQPPVCLRSAGWTARDRAGGEPRCYAAVLDATAVGPGTSVLDLGCGAGTFARAAADRGARVTGIDTDPAAVARAAAAVPEGAFARRGRAASATRSVRRGGRGATAHARRRPGRGAGRRGARRARSWP